MPAESQVAAPSHNAQREQRDRQYEGEQADNDADVDETDAHPYSIGGQSKPTPRSRPMCAMGVIRAFESVLRQYEFSSPNAPTTRVPSL